jgi:hypothetical protein
MLGFPAAYARVDGGGYAGGILDLIYFCLGEVGGKVRWVIWEEMEMEMDGANVWYVWIIDCACR